MDAFWIIPLLTFGIALVWGFWVYMRRQPESPSTPRVLVDKPSNQPPMDPASKDRIPGEKWRELVKKAPLTGFFV